MPADCCVIRITLRNTHQRSNRKGPHMIDICPLADLPPGEALRVDTVPPIAVFHTEDGEVFAIDDTCTHQDASLADGWLEGCEVECPLHASRFDLRTGAVDAPPAKLPGPHARRRVEDGIIYVELSTDDAEPAARHPRPGSPRGEPREARRRSSARRWPDCRRRARCARQGFDGRLDVIGDESQRPYDRPPLSKEFLAGDVTEADLALECDDEDLDATWLLGAPAVSTRRRVRRNRTRRRTRIDADGVVLATGSRRAALPGSDELAGVHVIAHPRRRPRPARRTAPRRPAGRHRRPASSAPRSPPPHANSDSTSRSSRPPRRRWRYRSASGSAPWCPRPTRPTGRR